MYGFAHVTVALTLAALLRLPVVIMLLTAMAPDLDQFLGLAHRGPSHTLVAAAAIAAVMFLLTDNRRRALAAGAGYVSHLVIDTFTYSGIMWLFPLERAFSLGLVESSSASANLLLSAYALAVFVLHRRQHVLRRWYRWAA